jgi:ABC-type glycerol-3-phosphate transport system permease component
MKRKRLHRNFDPTAAPLPFRIFNTIFLTLLSASFIMPFFLMAVQSVTPEEEIVMNGFRLWPDKFTTFAYEYLFTSSTQFVQAFKITAILTVIGTANTLFWTSMGAYALSRKYLPYRRGLTIFVTITMMFNGGLIPWFIIVKGLGMMNSLTALFIPGTINVWNMIIMRNYFMSLPESLEESAKLDGASDFTVYFRIIIPISMPIIATMIVYIAVGYWNEWYNALLFITTNQDLTTLQLLLRKIINSTGVAISSRGGRKLANSAGMLTPSESLKMASVMVATVPILVIYPFLQKYFVKGIMIGSIKG